MAIFRAESHQPRLIGEWKFYDISICEALTLHEIFYMHHKCKINPNSPYFVPFRLRSFDLSINLAKFALAFTYARAAALLFSTASSIDRSLTSSAVFLSFSARAIMFSTQQRVHEPGSP